jgi:4'-phosphopantetheinyl transferase
MWHRPLASPLPFIEKRWQLGDGSRSCGALVLFSLEAPDADREQFASLLSGEEAARAARFLADIHRQHFVVAHARLRQLLAAPLGLAPEAIAFGAGPHGKPELAGTGAKSGLHFNLSHSDGVGLVGWSWNRQIGVDVEVWRTMRDAAALVRRFFSPAEGTAWEALPEGERQEAFFNLWTRKEAYIKALGRGLSLPLDSFDVSHQSSAGARLLRPSALAADGRPWSLAAPAGEPGLSLAVVLEAGVCHTSPEV